MPTEGMPSLGALLLAYWWRKRAGSGASVSVCGGQRVGGRLRSSTKSIGVAESRVGLGKHVVGEEL